MNARVLTSPFSRWIQRIGIDSTVLWAGLGRILSVLIGPVSAVLIAYYFSPALQGYHYTFLNLVALQIFVELGLSGIITTFASHEWAQLSWQGKTGISGDAKCMSRLSSLTIFSFRWFISAGLLLSLVLAIGGWIFLTYTPTRDQSVIWQAPWFALCVTTSLNVMLVPAFAILQGCGQVHAVYRYRFTESLLRAGMLWAGLIHSAGLWAASCSSLAGLLWAVGFLLVCYKSFFLSLFKAKSDAAIAWKKDIWPLQWKIALSWISGYFTFFLFTPALFYFQGPQIAGQMGMTWSLITGASGLAGIWLQVRAPSFGKLVALKDFAGLDRIALKAAVLSFATACLGAIAMMALVLILEIYSPNLRARLLPLTPIMLFMTAEAFQQLSFVQSSYLRAFKQEPFLSLSLSMGLMMSIATIFSAKYIGALGIAAAYLTIVLLSLLIAIRIFTHYRRLWTR